jgi:hypothetical protein
MGEGWGGGRIPLDDDSFQGARMTTAAFDLVQRDSQVIAYLMDPVNRAGNLGGSRL